MYKGLWCKHTFTRDITYELPRLQYVRLVTLQSDHISVRTLLELILVIKTDF